ncbi:Tat pathway signal protein [Caldovatus aquaticus]|uniref:Tat pathway signal protein n=1 Tax=Caldovatus aquaticus TaxID=2865671 RepID=A0ABS7F2T4_9PROT|nr:Tat pathway signal protein [Caldovatus aquaticus]MBW8269110.1 Tat pathway signal protein [Caldovatus aquaticus]
MRRAFVAAFTLVVALCATAAPARAQNRFWLVNASGMTIQEAYVSPSRLSSWGPDILGASVLPAGQQVWVTPHFGDCILDVRVRYANGAEDTRMGVNACRLSRIVFGGGAGASVGGAGASISPAPGVAGNPSFTFVNQSGATIRELYVSLSSDRNWGPDRLGANVLSPGQSVSISLPVTGVCTVDMRVVYMNGAAAERRGVETCSITSYGWR